jgi:uncharacterized protein (TIGR03084 family)
MQQAQDYMAEAEDLANVLQKQPDSSFSLETLFKSWTVNDVIGHLYMFDVAALETLKSADAFEAFYAPIAKQLVEGRTLLQCQYPYLGKLTGRALFEQWRVTSKKLSLAYLDADPKLRVKWAGPSMSTVSTITSRQMETWSHGQEIFDALGIRQPAKDRIRNICHLGVATFDWSFKNRGMPIPEPVPYVNLTAPSGVIWEWNDASSPHSISGEALEFAQVVTQVRSVEDTKLNMVGPTAKQWMQIAQCFAGKPEIPPSKGTRFRKKNK